MPILVKVLFTFWALCGFTGLMAIVGCFLFDNKICEKIFPYAWGIFAGMFFVAAVVGGINAIWSGV